MNLPVEVIEAVREDRCVVFLGNRVSLEAAELKDRAYPEQKALARQLGWRKPTAVVGKKGTIASVEEGAAAYERANGRAGLLALLERELGGLETPSPAHLAVVRRFPLVFTSNYDDLLERAGREAGVTVDVLGRQSPIPDPEPGTRTRRSSGEASGRWFRSRARRRVWVCNCIRAAFAAWASARAPSPTPALMA